MQTDERIEALSASLRQGRNSVVKFRQLYLPAQDELPAAPFHWDWDEILLRGAGNFAVEAYRESGKTALVIRGHTLHRLVYPTTKYDYLVFILHDQDTATKRLNEIADEYLSNPLLSWNLEGVIRRNEKAFEVNVRSLTGKVINVRIEAYGKGAGIRGLSYQSRRPKLVLVDDPQDHDDMESQVTLEKDWDWFLSDLYFLGRKTRIFMIGNNLGPKCMIERVISAAEDFNFKTMVIPEYDEDSRIPAWPDQTTIEEIEKERAAFAAQGKQEVWWREKMCQAINPETQRFRKEYFRYYDPTSFHFSNISTYITVDPAMGEKQKKGCYTAIVVNSVTDTNHWMLRDVVYGNLDPTETMNAIFRLVSEYRGTLVSVGIERVAYQGALEFFMRSEMPRRNIFFTIVPLIADKKKELRIETIQPRFFGGTVWFPKGAPWVPEMEQELMLFPRPRLWDCMDALAYQEQIALPPLGAGLSDMALPLAGSM